VRGRHGLRGPCRSCRDDVRQPAVQRHVAGLVCAALVLGRLAPGARRSDPRRRPRRRRTAVAAPNQSASQTNRAWTSGFGFTSSVGADERGPGYRSSGGGGTVGFDHFFSPTLLGGVALSYSRGETTSLGARSESDTVSGAVYGAWAPYGGWELEGLLGIDSMQIDTTRVLTFGGVPVVTRGDTNSLGFSAAGNVGYRFRFAAPGGDAFFKPFAGSSYSSEDRDEYAEFGAFGPGLVFPSKTFERGALNLGGATGIDLNVGNRWIVRHELRLAWSHYFTDPSPDVPAFLGNMPIVLRDPQPGRNGAVVGLEVTGYTAGLQVFAGYAGEVPVQSDGPSRAGRIALDMVGRAPPHTHTPPNT